MPESLHLEFICTDAEKKQARSLLLQRQIGGGSKVLTTVILLVLLAGMLLGFYFRVQREVAPANRPYVYAAVFGVALLAWIWIRRSRASTLAVSEGERLTRMIRLRTRRRYVVSGFNGL